MLATAENDIVCSELFMVSLLYIDSANNIVSDITVFVLKRDVRQLIKRTLGEHGILCCLKLAS